MKQLKIILFIFFLSFLFISCEDVVDVDLSETEPRVVIEATGIQLENEDEGEIRVRISKSVPYFSNGYNFYPNAQVFVSIAGETYEILDQPDDNSIVFRDTIPMIYDENYELTVNFEGETYTATTRLQSTVPFDYVEQNDNGVSEDEVVINAYFTDPEDEENFYYFEFSSQQFKRNVIDNTNDELFDGNQISTFLSFEFEPGDMIDIKIQGTDKQFNSYFNILLSQTENSGNPFAANPATVRGNIINPNNPDEFAFGYFRMSQQFSTSYTIQ